MQNTIFAILLFAVGLLPYTGQKLKWENQLREQLAPIISLDAKKGSTFEPFELKNIPEKSSKFETTSASALSALFIDEGSGEILFEKNKNKKLSMASTTKLMTALIAVEKLKLDEVVTVPSVSPRPLDSVVGLVTGDKIKVSELLHGLLIESGSDAALTISGKIAGGEHQFAALMNEKATILGLKNTQFTNSVGYDDQNHYSNAEDLIKLARVALSNKTIAEIVAKPSYVATSELGRKYHLSNTNKLLGGVFKGVKTGTTFVAGECLISFYNDGTRKIIGVVLGSPDRFYETKNIIDWAKNNFVWLASSEAEGHN